MGSTVARIDQNGPNKPDWTRLYRPCMVLNFKWESNCTLPGMFNTLEFEIRLPLMSIVYILHWKRLYSKASYNAVYYIQNNASYSDFN